MRLTRAASYAIQALAYMTVQKLQRPMASHQIAQARGIPERFLLKVLKPLVAARVLQSVKGPNGGYRLARNAHDITLLEIVEAVDGPIRGPASYSRNEIDPTLQKHLDQVCQQASSLVRKHFQKVRLSELASRD